MHVDCSINTSYDISAVWEIIAQGRIMTLITPFKPFKHTLLVNTLNVKGHFVFFKKKNQKKKHNCVEVEIHMVCKGQTEF